MKKICQLLPKLVPRKGDVGIEIECEGEKLVAVDDKTWTTTSDGSLRGQFPNQCLEWILKEPIPISKVKDALVALKESQKEATFAFSFRTSVHVHINAQELTHKQLVNMIYTYMLIEEPLMSYCGKERKGNRFCLRLQDAEGSLEYIEFLITNQLKDFGIINEGTIRYAALNLAALTKYGSLEFRAMRGNLDVNVLHTWVSALIQLRNYAMEIDNPTKIYEEFCTLGCVGFLDKVLGDYAKAFHYPKMEKDLQRSFSLSLDIPFTYKMNAYRFKEDEEELPPAPKPAPKKKNPLANFVIVDDVVRVDAPPINLAELRIQPRPAQINVRFD